MSPNDDLAMTTEQLVTHFVAYAKQLGLGRRFLAVGGVAPLDSPASSARRKAIGLPPSFGRWPRFARPADGA